jgi:GTP pyrophosphokinase
MVNLDYHLENRDVVEIVLAAKNDKSGPNRSWLDFVKTAKARQNIRSFYKKINREENVEAGQKLLVTELVLLGMSEDELTEEQKNELISENSWKSWEDVLAAIGEGTITARQVIKKVVGQKIYLKRGEKLNIPQVAVEEEQGSYSNLAGILVRYAACCNPKAGDEIKGFITQGQGITIHKADCTNLLASPKEKIISVDFDIPKAAIIRVEIVGTNRVGFIRDISSVISNLGININQIQNEHTEEANLSQILVDLAIEDADKLSELLHKLTNVDGVVRVRKR